MSQLRVIVDQFSAGGAPSTKEQWRKLFEYRVAARNNEISSKNLCGACAAFFEFNDHLSLFSLL